MMPGDQATVELRLMAAQQWVEPLGDALLELGALSISVEDADAQTDAEQALFGEPGMDVPVQGWQRSRLCALYPDASAAQAAWAQVQTFEGVQQSCQFLGLQAVPEQDWVRLTQSQFEPVEITPDFWIVPTWHQAPAQAGRVLRLDPGLAFGTGTHPTTRMCLRWLTRQGLQGRTVLDYGCGSGILAIAAALHGASQVDAVDIDPSAVCATEHNALANGVTVRCGLPDLAHGSYDIVLANILATPLKVLAPLICAHVAQGGALVLAGILERQTQELVQAYAPWVSLQVDDAQEGWVLLTASRAML